ncbi:MAG: murein L,D-transpeptidase catalytic domain family protein [Bacteroidetes bacterium]|nr:murein L,D-transpeptidase catalytic domain family protein [Bacteroidota bacterium]
MIRTWNLYFIVLTVIGEVAVFILLVSAKADVRMARPNKVKAAFYNNMHLMESGLNEDVFELAVKGWEKMKERGELASDTISICDFSQSSNCKRFYVIDMNKGRLLFNTLIAHGRNTGEEFARYFSNEPSSNKSSLGFYKTKSTYSGEHGLSLRLEGKEKGFNDRAEQRAIVMHGAEYVDESFIRHFGRLGRSLGCPSIPYEFHEQVINTIKDGCCLFIYYPDRKYLSASRLLN